MSEAPVINDAEQARAILSADKPKRGRRRKNLPSTAITDTDTAVQQRPFLVVDSTATADAAAQYLPHGWSVTFATTQDLTSLGSATHAVIWGQNDEGGRAWAESVADAVAIPVHVISLSSAPPHWHLSDGLPEDRTPAQLTEFLLASLQRCQFRNGHALGEIPGLPEDRGSITVPITEDAYADFIRTPTGAIRPLLANVVHLLRQFPGRWDLRYDLFSNRPFLGNEPMHDRDMREIAVWVQNEGVHAAKSIIDEGVIRIAETQPFHPVKEYLESVTWDGVDRLDHFLTDHGGARDDPHGLTNAMGRRWMIQAVARIYEPGCQADAMLILEGRQGLRKSTLFRELFGDKWFTDHLPNLADKDAMLQLCGVWCVEVSELATLDRSDSAKIKQFLTSRIDRFRAPFGRLVADNPRTSVFGGTINPGAEGYLKDPTGGRRFWPVPVEDQVNIPEIVASRDQLWAEALHRYQQREPWWITDQEAELHAAASQRQQDRYEDDPWADVVAGYVVNRATVTAADILRFALNLSNTSEWSRGEQMRIGRIMTSLGWARRKSRDGEKTKWEYANPAPPESGAYAEPPESLFPQPE